MNTPNSQDDTQYFDRRARSYERTIGNIFIDPIHHILLDLAVQASQDHPPESVIDVGCGTGRLLRSAGKRWPAAHLIGVDPSPGMLEVARQRTPGVTFYNGSAENLPLPDHSADLVLSTLSFHHWNNREAGLRDIGRVLRPDGHFCLADLRLPAAFAWLTHHVDGNNPTYWRALFTQAGFDLRLLDRRMTGFLLVAIGVISKSEPTYSHSELSPH